MKQNTQNTFRVEDPPWVKVTGLLLLIEGRWGFFWWRASAHYWKLWINLWMKCNMSAATNHTHVCMENDEKSVFLRTLTGCTMLCWKFYYIDSSTFCSLCKVISLYLMEFASWEWLILWVGWSRLPFPTTQVCDESWFEVCYYLLPRLFHKFSYTLLTQTCRFSVRRPLTKPSFPEQTKPN